MSVAARFCRKERGIWGDLATYGQHLAIAFGHGDEMGQVPPGKTGQAFVARSPYRILAGQVERHIDLRPGIRIVVQQHAIGRCVMLMKIEIEREMVKAHAPAGPLHDAMQIGKIKRLGDVVGQFLGEMQRHDLTARWHGSAAQAPIVIA